jgi:hypothetical protein
MTSSWPHPIVSVRAPRAASTCSFAVAEPHGSTPLAHPDGRRLETPKRLQILGAAFCDKGGDAFDVFGRLGCRPRGEHLFCDLALEVMIE